MEGQHHSWSTDGRWTAHAHRILRGSLCIAVATTLSVLVLVRVSGAACCVCQGNFVLGCTIAVGPGTCSGCAAFCATGGATVRACCDNVADCSGGAADSCPAGDTACAQPFAGAGQFCDGTCAGVATPTATPSGSPTTTQTVTPTSTPGPAAPAPTLSVRGWFAALAVLVAVATLALRRRRLHGFSGPR